MECDLRSLKIKYCDQGYHNMKMLTKPIDENHENYL